jgi:hypothetical protein
MKRKKLMALFALTVMALIVTAYARNPKTGNPPVPCGQNSKSAKKVLVKRLPANVEGVELKGDRVLLKEGYKFVKESNNTISVARIKGGGGISGGWDCACSKEGNCGVSVGDTGLDCLMESCKGSCTLKVTVGNRATSVIAFAR